MEPLEAGAAARKTEPPEAGAAEVGGEGIFSRQTLGGDLESESRGRRSVAIYTPTGGRKRSKAVYSGERHEHARWRITTGQEQRQTMRKTLGGDLQPDRRDLH